MKTWIKRILITVLVVALVGGLAAGGLYWRSHAGGSAINVYSVQDLSVTEYWEDSNESYGPVSTDQTQSVFLSSTQTVKEILVKQGQAVQKGDVLMTYDTTLSEVEVEKKGLEIQKLEQDLKKAKADLEKIKKYRPGVPIAEKDLVTMGDDSSLKADVPTAAVSAREIPVGTFLAANSWGRAGEAALEGLLAAVTSGGTSPSEGETTAPSSEEIKEDTPTGGTEPSESEFTSPTTEPETTPEATMSPTETEEPTPETTEPIPETTQVPETTESEEETTQAPETTESEEETTQAPETTESPEETTQEEEQKGYPALEGGKGTKKKPYLYNWNESCTFTQDFLAYVTQGKKSAYVTLQVLKGKGENAIVTSYWKMKVKKKGGVYEMEMLEICVDGQICRLEDQEEEESTEDMISDDPLPDIPIPDEPGFSYTREEIARLRNDTEERIRDLDLEIRMGKVAYAKLENELNNGSVLCEVDGVVAAVRDADESKINNEAVIDVSGGGGYYAEGYVSELALDSVQIGQPVTVTSMESGGVYEGKVTEISEYPMPGYYNGGNTNASYYPFKVFVDESAKLQENEYVMLNYGNANTAAGDAGVFYLQKSMIRTENGESYVYVKDEEGKLRRQTIKTGKVIWDSYLEIREGLELTDYIAFPYGKDLREGATAQDASVDALYNY